MPHGYFYLWNPLMLWLNVVSDSLITLLLVRRTKVAGDGQRMTRIIGIFGAITGLALWTLARLAANREIGISSRAQAQVKALNAELEQRVEQAVRVELVPLPVPIERAFFRGC